MVFILKNKSHIMRTFYQKYIFFLATVQEPDLFEEKPPEEMYQSLEDEYKKGKVSYNYRRNWKRMNMSGCNDHLVTLFCLKTWDILIGH